MKFLQSGPIAMQRFNAPADLIVWFYAEVARVLTPYSDVAPVKFFVSNIEEGPAAQTEIFDLVFRHCTSANIRLAPPQGSSVILPLRDALRSAVDAPNQLLRHLSIFASLSADERVALELKLNRRSYKAGDVIIQKGTVAPALFILSSGVLVALGSCGAEEEEVKRLAPGEFFGQGGVLTGAAAIFNIKALTKAVVYEIAKDDLAPILKERPAIATELGQILARLQAVDKARLEELAHPDRHNENLAARLAEQVKDLGAGMTVTIRSAIKSPDLRLKSSSYDAQSARPLPSTQF